VKDGGGFCMCRDEDCDEGDVVLVVCKHLHRTWLPAPSPLFSFRKEIRRRDEVLDRNQVSWLQPLH
jgi:hypothetical protein